MKKNLHFLLIPLFVLLSTALVWLPFFLKLVSFWKIPLPQEGMATIMKNFDGLYYVVIAKSLYQPEKIFSFPLSLSANYYAAHFPLYPLLIRVTAPLIGYLWAMLAWPVIGAVLAGFAFYSLLKEFGLKNRLWLTTLFLFLPARWLAVRTVGSPEPLFMAATLTSLLFFKRKNCWLAGLLGAAAQLIKPPGLLLFAAYGLCLLWENKHLFKKSFGKWLKTVASAFPLLLIPFSLLGLFFYYRFAYGDFLAYFHSGDNIHLFWPPFQVFNASAYWVGTFWLEEIVYIFLLGALGTTYLFKQKRYELAFFSLIFFLSTAFVSHRDIARYSLPAAPMLIIAFEKMLSKKEFQIVFGVILIPIFLYTINFLAGNTLSLGDWTPFL